MIRQTIVACSLMLSACAVQPSVTPSAVAVPSPKSVALTGAPDTRGAVAAALSRLGWTTSDADAPPMRFAFSERDGAIAIWDESQPQAVLVSAPRERRWYEGCTPRKLRFSFAIEGEESGASEMTACRFLAEDYERLVIAAINRDAATMADGL